MNASSAAIILVGIVIIIAALAWVGFYLPGSASNNTTNHTNNTNGSIGIPGIPGIPGLGGNTSTNTTNKTSTNTTNTTNTTNITNTANASVTILAPAPPSVTAGSPITITWRVNASKSMQINHTGVHYDVFPVPKPSKPEDYTFAAPPLCETSNCTIPNVFSVNFNITQPGRYFYRAHAIVNGAQVWSPEYNLTIVSNSAQNNTGGTGTTGNGTGNNTNSTTQTGLGTYGFI